MSKEPSPNAFFRYFLSETIRSGHGQPGCFGVVIDSGATSKPIKAPHHRPVEDRCILLLHTASSWAGRHAALWLHCFCSLLLVENSSPYTRALERYSAEHCRQDNPAPLCLCRGGGQARPVWSFSPLMGWGRCAGM